MEKLSGRVADLTRQEWRELGLYYVTDESAKEWQFAGSRLGLLSFADRLAAYAADVRRASQGEHNHYGPHCYLKIMTWPNTGADSSSIRGPQSSIALLARLIRESVSRAGPGESIRIREQFCRDAEYTLVFNVHPDLFDPASLDPQLADDLR